MMYYKENFHTHSTYCDGKNAPEEMVKAAIEKGFTALGFSGHSHLDFDCGWCMTAEGTKEYISVVHALKEKYADKINIYCGTEHDILSTGINKSDYDFTLGAVHYIPVNGEYLAVDESGDTQKRDADKYFGGSMLDYAVAYYKEVGDVLDKTDGDIIAHFDLLTKFNESGELFDTSDRKYRNACFEAAEKLLAYNRPFEINTGAIARKKRLTPYPSLEIADFIHSKGGYFVINSDCHDTAYLDCFFEEAMQMYSKYNIVSFEEILKSK